MGDQSDPEDLDTPVMITKGELAQLSLTFNSCKAMAEQVQSLATEIAQLRLLSPTGPHTMAIPVPKILQPDPFTGDRLDLDTYLTGCQHVFLTQPSLFLMEQHKVLYAASY